MDWEKTAAGGLTYSFIICNDDGTKVAAVTRYGGPDNKGYTFVSKDSFRTWIASPTARQEYWGIAPDSTYTRFIVAGRGPLGYSNDSGLTVNNVNGINGNYGAVITDSSFTKWLSFNGRDGIIYGGKTGQTVSDFTTLNYNSDKGYWRNIVANEDFSKAIAIGDRNLIKSSPDLINNPSGTWSNVNTGKDRNWMSVAGAKDLSKIILVANNTNGEFIQPVNVTSIRYKPNAPLVSVDGGVTWSEYTFFNYTNNSPKQLEWINVKCNFDFSQVLALTSTELFYCGDPTNINAAWFRINIPGPFTSIAVTPNFSHIYGTVWEGGIYRKVISSTTKSLIQPYRGPIVTPPVIPSSGGTGGTGGTGGVGATGIFMRGDRYDFTTAGGFYIVAKDNNGSYYYLTKPLDEDILNTNVVFSSINYKNVEGYQSTIFIKSSGGNKYTMKGSYFLPKGSSQQVSNGNLVINSSGVVDISTTGNTGTVFTLSAVGVMDGDGTNIYPGIWYNMTSGTNPVSFNVQNCSSSTTPFCSTLSPGITQKQLSIMLIPINLSTSQTVIYTNGQCSVDTPPSKDLPLSWFNSWVLGDQNAPVNCNTGNYITNASNNCFFSNLAGCQNGFLYNIGQGICSPTTLGTCSTENGVMTPCIFDHSLEPPIPPYTCTPGAKTTEESTSSKSKFTQKQIIIFWVIIAVIILVCIGLYFWFSKKTPQDENYIDNTNE